MSVVNRIGTFLFVVGIGLIVLFILSDLAKAPSCNFLAAGAIALILGILLWVRDPVQPGPKAERFRTARRLFSKKTDSKKK